MIDQSIFRTYNIRGTYPNQINADVTRKIAEAFLWVVKPKNIVIGHDGRLSSPELHKAFVETVLDAGIDVTDIGMVNTDRVYFAVGKYGFDLGVVVSASHNPVEWNGFKGAKRDVEPMSPREVIAAKEFILSGQKLPKSGKRGTLKKMDTLDDYLAHALTFVDKEVLKPRRVLVNNNFGMMAEVVRALQKWVPLDVVPLNFEVDGHFPKGQPDPLLQQNRAEVTERTREEKVDFAVAWDADGDRCYFHDENGEFVRGAFVTAMLAKLALEKKPGGKIVSEPRIIWPVRETVEKAGGELILHATGYVLIREKMREVGAIFGGENSAHYFFPENWFAEIGIVPFLKIWEHLSKTGIKMSEFARPFREKYFVSEEINFPLPEIQKGKEILAEAEKQYGKSATIDHIAGLSVNFSDWRFNLRASDNEPLIRLNLEARNQKLLDEKTAELTEFVKKLA